MQKFLLVSCLISLFSCSSNENNGNTSSLVCKDTEGPVACYGKLIANGSKLTGSKTGDRALQLRGVSLGWSNTGWESARFFTEDAVNALVDGWKAEIIRVPVGYAASSGLGEYNGSYLADRTRNMNRAKTAIEAAINKGVYVIIDWHSHDAHLKPGDAVEFFTEMASAYGNNNHVIFEIYNEPNCKEAGVSNCPNNTVQWADIKSYAETVIPAIREHSSNLILVGTRFYSRYVTDAIGNEPSCTGCNNLAYVLHFYAENHTLNRYVSVQNDPNDPTFKQAITRAMDAGLLVFVSEYGTTNSNGGQGDKYNSHSTESADEWHSFMDEKKISSCAWNVNDKNEGSAFFGVGSSFDMVSWTDENKMTASGKYIFNKLKTYSKTAEWRGE